MLISQIQFNNKTCLATALVDTDIDRIIDLQIAAKDKESLLGNIYVGKVSKIAPHINAAFIDIKPNFSCYYPLGKNKVFYATSIPKRDTLKAGDELLVQVTAESLKEKIPTVTSHLNIASQYAVLSYGKKGVGISAKLTDTEKLRLKELLAPYASKEYGIVARTNAANAPDEAVLSDVQGLVARWDEVRHLGDTRTCYSLIDTAKPDYIQALDGIKNDNLVEIITDDKDVFTYLQNYSHHSGVDYSEKLRFYDDKMLSLAKLYSLESTLDNACKDKVWLKSGGFLVIQQTAAFVAIDVNSGKFQSKKEAAKTYQKINIEAAAEIAIQLRLRNLSGIILIDFINMKSEIDQEFLLETLQKQLRQDNMKAVVVDITPLGIVEATRKKARKSLAEQIADI